MLRSTTKRNNNLVKYSFLLVLVILCLSNTYSQTYHSTPTAIKNLNDEASYVNYLLENELTVGSSEYSANLEKQRFISSLLYEIGKTTNPDIKTIAEKFLPNTDLSKMQVAVNYFDASHTGTTPIRYIREELMSLISY